MVKHKGVTRVFFFTRGVITGPTQPVRATLIFREIYVYEKCFQTTFFTFYWRLQSISMWLVFQQPHLSKVGIYASYESLLHNHKAYPTPTVQHHWLLMCISGYFFVIVFESISERITFIISVLRITIVGSIYRLTNVSRSLDGECYRNWRRRMWKEVEKPDPGGTSTSINAGNDVCHVVRFKNIPAEV